MSIHYIDINNPDNTACGIPSPNGQVFGRNGEPLPATTIEESTTCDSCNFKLTSTKETR